MSNEVLQLVSHISEYLDQDDVLKLLGFTPLHYGVK